MTMASAGLGLPPLQTKSRYKMGLQLFTIRGGKVVRFREFFDSAIFTGGGAP